MTMLAEHIDEAVKKLCPLGKPECFMATIGACSVINKWIGDHRAPGISTELISSPEQTARLQAAGRKGGNATAMKRGTYDDI